MERTIYPLSRAPGLPLSRPHWADRSRAPPPIPTYRSVIATAFTPRSSSRTPFRSPTPSRISCWASFGSAIRCRPISVRSTRPTAGAWLRFLADHRTIAVVAIGSNAVNFIDTATNSVKHVTYVGRSPHEAFFTPDGKEVWVVVRGENYVAVLDGATYQEKTRIVVANGPGMTIFSPDGKYGYVCSSFTPETAIITVADHKIVGKVRQASPFCPNIAATPDGSQVWFTLKDIGKAQVFDAQAPFSLLKTSTLVRSQTTSTSCVMRMACSPISQWAASTKFRCIARTIFPKLRPFK